MKILKTTVLVLFVGLAFLVLISFFLPSKVRIVESGIVKAPKDSVHKQINQLQKWQNWSPWHKIDPKNTKYTFSNPDSGTGSSYTWSSSNSKVGSGKLKVALSTPDSIVTALTFEDNGSALATYTFKTIPEGTKVEWSFESDFSKPPVIGKYIALLFTGMIRDDYKKGLKNLDSLLKK